MCSLLTEEWWNQALFYIKCRSDYQLSREMNWISKQIIAWKGYEALAEITSKIGTQLMSAEDDILR